MGIFDRIIQKGDRIVNNEWVAWVHEGYKDYKINYNVPANVYVAQLEKERNKSIQNNRINKKCCALCFALNSCHFAKWNMPPQPLHPNCHCYTQAIETPIKNKTVFVICPIEKFKEYVFKNIDKKYIFEHGLGYNINDSQYLKEWYESQALEKYMDGDYSLNELNKNGQKITIVVETRGQQIKTGWMINPNGYITCTAPFSGNTKGGN